jgi:hypothetical protein
VVPAASATARSIAEIGGAAKLSDAELKSATRTIDAALQKYGRLGTEAPAALRTLQQELRGWHWKLPLAEALDVSVASVKSARFQLALWAILPCGR